MDRDALKVKYFDAYGQLAVAVIPLMLSVLYAPIMFISLFGLAIWQLISFFGNITSDYPGRQLGLRRIYGGGLAILAFLGIGAVLIKDLILPFLITALTAAVVLGIFYLVISAIELHNIRQHLAKAPEPR